MSPTEQKALLEAHGLPGRRHDPDKADVDRIRAERDATIDAEAAAKAALDGSAAKQEQERGRRAPSARSAPTTGRTPAGAGSRSRAPPRRRRCTCTVANGRAVHLHRPALVGRGIDAHGTAARLAATCSATSTRTSARTTTCTTSPDFRLGNAGDGAPMPAFVRIAAPNGDVDSSPSRSGSATAPPQHAAGFCRTSTRTTSTRRRATRRCATLAAEFPNISQVYRPAEQDDGLPAQGADDARLSAHALHAARRRPPPAPRADHGQRARRPDLEGLGPPGRQRPSPPRSSTRGANNAPLSVALAGKAITVSPATDATGAITSTAAAGRRRDQRQPATSASSSTATLYRTNTRRGRRRGPAPSVAAQRLAEAPRRATRAARRTGEDAPHRQDVQRRLQGRRLHLLPGARPRVAHARCVCLETAERLVRNYGTDPETTKLVDNLDIFIIPTINADGADVLDVRLQPQRKNMVNYCASNPTGNERPVRRATAGASTSTATSRSAPSSTASRARRSRTAPSGNFAGPFELSEPEVRNETVRADDVHEHQVRQRTSTPPAATSCGRRAPTRPARVAAAVPAVRHAELLRPDRAHGPRRITVPPRHGDPAAADRPRDRRPLLGRRQLRGRGVLQPRHHRLRLRDRRHALQRHGHRPPRPAARVSSRRSAPTPTNTVPRQRGQRTRAMEFANGNYGLLQLRAGVLQRHGGAGRRHRRRRPTASTPAYSVKFTSNEAASIYYTTDGSTPTTASTEWKPTRARALPLPLDLAPEHDAQVDRERLQGQHLRGQVAGRSARPTRPAPSAAASRPTLAPDAGRSGARSARSRRASPRSTRPPPPPPSISTAGDATLSVADPSTTNTGKLVNGTFALASAAAGPRHDQDVDRPDLQRVGADHVQAVDRGQRAAAHGHVQQDADVHPEHDDPVANSRGAGPAGAPRRRSPTSRPPLPSSSGPAAAVLPSVVAPGG